MFSAALVPQMIKVYRTKSAKDISTTFQCFFITGAALVVTYGIGEGLWPIYIPCSMELIGGITLMLMKCRYDRLERNADAIDDHGKVMTTPNEAQFQVVLTPKR